MRRGYTLVEVLISLAILVLVLLPILAAVGHAIKTTQEGRNITEATQLARSRLNELWELVGPTSSFYPGGIPFDFEGGARGGTAIPNSLDPELAARLTFFRGGPGAWTSGQDYGGDSRTGVRESTVAMRPTDYGCLAAEPADSHYNDNLFVCIDPTDPNESAIFPSEERYRTAMAVFAARMDPLDALAHYFPSYHPDAARWVAVGAGVPCISSVGGDCAKIDGVEDFGEIVDHGSLTTGATFLCATSGARADSRGGVGWWEFGYIADGDDPDDNDDIPAPGYLDTYWRFIVADGHPVASPVSTNAGRDECEPRYPFVTVASDIARSLETHKRFRRQTTVATIYFPADAHDPVDGIDGMDARYYRSSAGVLGRLVRVAVAWRSGKGCPTRASSGGVFTSRCGDPTNAVRVGIGLPERVVDLNKEVELRAFIPDPDQDPCDREPFQNTPTQLTNVLGVADWDGDPDFQHEECWNVDGVLYFPPGDLPFGGGGGGGGGGGFLTICHYPPGQPNNPRTITIAPAAWPAHERHGDTVGACA
ncbi:prepilin-type N-terminal cleavage/methylation domain-containing protein [bacterium]|nr:prepilin-type N-terminal cleavage/methylation domain-containing protein [bacterium]